MWFLEGRRKGANLCEEHAGDALGHAKQCLFGIFIGLTESLSKIARICQHRSAMFRRGVELGLLREGLVGHCEGLPRGRRKYCV
jgi:hypothetical protein